MIYEFSATQDLHGYDKPWAPGRGKNLIANADDSYTINANSYHTYNVDDLAALAGEQVTFSLPDEDFTSDEYIRLYKFGSPGNNKLQFGSRGANSVSFAMPDDIGDYSTIRFYYTAPSGTQRSFSKAQLELGSTATSYAPYSNICPPEGFDIWDPINQDFVQVYAGFVNANTRELLLRPVYPEYDGEELVGPWMSSMDEYDEDTTPTEGAFVIDFGGELTSYEITSFMLQTLLDSLGIRLHFLDGASLLNSLMDQAQGRVRSENELLNRSLPLNVIAIGDQLPTGLTFKPITKDVLPGLPGNLIR